MRVLLALSLIIAVQANAAEGGPLTPLDSPRPAPEFSLADTAGDTHTLADYRGRVLVVNFWATWCPPCVKEMPALDRLQQQLGEAGVQVVGINMGETTDDIASFNERVPVDFPLLLSPDMSAGQDWGVRGLPTTFILDPEGRIVFEVLGDQPWDDATIVDQIRELAP